MISFRIRLAEIPMQIQVFYASTKEFCKAYLTEESPQIEIVLDQADIEKERKLSVEQNLREDKIIVNYPDQYLETLALYRKITDALFPYNILLFHGSVIAVNGKAYLFTAKSGVGKTTHTRLWLKNIPNCYILNGDKPLLLFKPDGIYACGTPWQGKENYGTNEILPLAAICILERGKSNSIERIVFDEAFKTLVMQSHHANAGIKLIQTVQMLQRMNDINLYRLYCNMDDDAAWVAYSGMVEKNI